MVNLYSVASHRSLEGLYLCWGVYHNSLKSKKRERGAGAETAHALWALQGKASINVTLMFNRELNSISAGQVLHQAGTIVCYSVTSTHIGHLSTIQ